MTKQEARAYYRGKRASLSVVSYAELQNQLLTHFKNIPFSSLQWVHSYLPMPSSNEIDTAPFISHLSFLFPGLNICVPVTPKGSDSIINALWEKNAVFVPNRFGIPEPTSITEIDPKQIDLVIVPLLAFDKAGYRVGYGKGYYDRFLVKCKEEATIIGLSFFPPLPCITDRQQFDIPLDLCITPEQIYEFG